MVCFEPNYIYMRHHYPINANASEKKLKRLNKPSFNRYQPDWIQMPVPCGKCEGCRLDRANDWATRITNELECWNNKGVFVTLTYNPKNLPYTEEGLPTLKQKDLQDFKKRLRKYCKNHEPAFIEWVNPITGKKERPIRTFEAGEYGEKYGRPHYHMLIMNWEPKDLKYWKTEDGNALYKSKTLQKIWGMGFTPIGRITYKSASYVARYTMKKNGLASKTREYYDIIDEEGLPKTKYRYVEGKVKSEFISMSSKPGIGRQWFIDNFQKVKENSCILIKSDNGVKIKRIPRYYKKLWEKMDWEDYERWKYQQQKLMLKNQIKLVESYNLPNNWLWERKLKFANDKKIEQFKAKMDKLRQRTKWE